MIAARTLTRAPPRHDIGTQCLFKLYSHMFSSVVCYVYFKIKDGITFTRAYVGRGALQFSVCDHSSFKIFIAAFQFYF